MKNFFTALFVIIGMLVAFIAGFWARDEIQFYRDIVKWSPSYFPRTRNRYSGRYHYSKEED